MKSSGKESWRLVKAIEKWASKIVACDGERFCFEWVTVTDSVWHERMWIDGVVSSRVRPGASEGQLLELMVDGNVILRAKSLCWSLDEVAVVGALLAHAFQPRTRSRGEMRGVSPKPMTAIR